MFKKKNNKNLILKLSFVLFSILLPFFCGLCTFNTTFIKQNASLYQLSNIAKISDNEKVYFQYTIDDKNTNKSLIPNLFINNYRNNFNSYTTQIVVNSNNNNLIEYSCSFLNLDISSTLKMCSTIYYSNINKRFETICIELLKERTISEELSREGFDDIIYLPDYFGDYIIENTHFETYDDILYSNIPFVVKLENNLSISYKIANFFHVNGFTELYSSNDELYRESDYNFGTYLGNFLNDFAIYGESKTLSESYSMVVMSSYKRFDLEQNISLVKQYNLNNDYIVSNKTYIKKNDLQVDLSNYFVNFFFTPSLFENVASYFCFSVLIICYIILFIFHLYFTKFNFKETKYLWFSIIFIVIYYILVHSLVQTLLSNSFIALSIFNCFFGVGILISLFSIIYLIFNIYGKKLF